MVGAFICLIIYLLAAKAISFATNRLLVLADDGDTKFKKVCARFWVYATNIYLMLLASFVFYSILYMSDINQPPFFITECYAYRPVAWSFWEVLSPCYLVLPFTIAFRLGLGRLAAAFAWLSMSLFGDVAETFTKSCRTLLDRNVLDDRAGTFYMLIMTFVVLEIASLLPALVNPKRPGMKMWRKKR